MSSSRKAVPAVLASCALALSTIPAQASSQRQAGSVRLFAPDHRVTMTVHQGEDPWIEFNPTLYLKARGTSFEIGIRRPRYDRPLQATVRIGMRTRTIPARYLDGWSGFRRAFVVTWRTPAGQRIARRTVPWCPNNGGSSRLAPGAAAESAFTNACGTHPFTRSHRWGVDRGWARQVLAYNIPVPGAPLGDRATLEVTLRQPLARLFGIPDSNRTQRFDVVVRHVTDPVEPEEPEEHVGARAGAVSSSTSSHRNAPRAPRTTAARPPADTLPDLISLPAYGISARTQSDRDFLDFAATVYNGGRGPLVAEGFRRGSQKLMDAYQMFYRDDRPVSSAKVGTMEYDTRDSHEHWHFKDFATYDLLDRNHRRVRTSGKEAFCLAPTDAIDLLAPGAVAEPGNGDLGTACGEVTSIWVREVLAAGWGDTYTQDRAGQSLNITDLPNGTYWLRVRANPAGRLIEKRTANNIALRRIVLGGTAGERTVRVPRLGLVDSESFGPMAG